MAGRRFSWLIVAAAGIAATSGLAGCSGARLAGPSLEARCRVGQSQTGLLVTEWGAAEKANLEAALQRGGVGVAFSGCHLRIVPQCRLAGVYRWHRTTPTQESIDLRSEADLFTKLPLGAVKLSGELKRSGRLQVTTTVAGQARLDGPGGEAVPRGQACDAVTHVVTAVSVGAFSLDAKRSLSGKASVGATVVGREVEAGGGGSRSARRVRAAGDPEACREATDQAPAANCASPIQVFLAPVPGRAPPPPPPGTVSVDLVSGDGDERWDVILEDQARCTTPCVADVNPDHPIVLRTRGRAPDQLRVAGLPRGAGPMQVVANPTRKGQFVTGLTFTALGGMGLIAGIALTGAGCGGDEPGLCRGGQITMLSTTPVLLGALWLMLDARADATVRPLFSAGPRGGSFGVSGRF